MAVITDYLEDAVLGHLFRTATFTKPAALYIGLMTAVANGETGSVTEVSGNGYARVARAPLDANWTMTAGSGVVSNAAIVTFPTNITANWGTVTHVGIWDAATAGNLWLYGSLTSPRTITVGNSTSFTIGSLIFQLDV
jgi:hypothetical protein